MKECGHIKELLSEYMDNMLDHSMRGQVQAHLEQCSDCKDEYEMLLKISDTIKKMDKAKAPDDFLEKLHEKIQTRKATDTFLKRLFQNSNIKVPVTLIIVAVCAYALLKEPHVQNLIFPSKSAQNKPIIILKTEDNKAGKLKEMENPDLIEPLAEEISVVDEDAQSISKAQGPDTQVPDVEGYVKAVEYDVLQRTAPDLERSYTPATPKIVNAAITQEIEPDIGQGQNIWDMQTPHIEKFIDLFLQQTALVSISVNNTQKAVEVLTEFFLEQNIDINSSVQIARGHLLIITVKHQDVEGIIAQLKNLNIGNVFLNHLPDSQDQQYIKMQINIIRPRE